MSEQVHPNPVGEPQPHAAEQPTGRADGGANPPGALHEPAGQPIPHAVRDDLAQAERLGRYAFACGFAPGRFVLDAGCGIGYGSAMLARAGALQVFGFDVNQHAVDQATTLFQSDSRISRFWAGDLMATGLPPRHFGLVTCFGVLDQVADPERALDELHRVVFPGGILICSISNRSKGSLDGSTSLAPTASTSGELEGALGDRFEHVAVYPQHMHLATLIGSASAHQAPDSETVIGGVIRKVEPTDPGLARGWVTMASDEPLPVPENLAVLGGSLSIKPWVDSIAAWEARALKAEADLAATNIHVGYLEETLKFRRRPLARLRRLFGRS